MRKFTYPLLFLLFVGCSDNKSANSDSQSGKLSDDTTKSAINIPDVKESVDDQADAFKIDFPLDSLLSFDSEAELKEIFTTNVTNSIGYYPEGMGEYTNTLLFPGTKNEVEFVWKDTINFSGLLYIELEGEDTDWKTKEGITIGTGIKELEELNKKPFTFYGLGWDYSGMIDWNEGFLYERKIFGNLEYPDDYMPDEFDALIGDREIESSFELAQKADLILRKITMRRSE